MPVTTRKIDRSSNKATSTAAVNTATGLVSVNVVTQLESTDGNMTSNVPAPFTQVEKKKKLVALEGWRTKRSKIQKAKVEKVEKEGDDVIISDINVDAKPEVDKVHDVVDAKPEAKLKLDKVQSIFFSDIVADAKPEASSCIKFNLFIF